MTEALRSDGPRASRDELPDLGVVLVGNPNVGKSALFGALTGNYVTVSNYPGTTVEMTRGSAVLEGEKVPVLDTPGTNSFNPASDDERVTRDVLLNGRPSAAVVVGDAKNLPRTVALALQVSEMRVPMVVCLNMADEAGARGIRVDTEGLARTLGVPVVSTVAVRGEGLDDLRAALRRAAPGRASVGYPPPIEEALAVMTPLLPSGPVAPRALALMLLSGDAPLLARVRDGVSHEAGEILAAQVRRIIDTVREPASYVMNHARTREAWRISERFTARETTVSARRGIASALERAATHRVLGVPFLLGVLYLAYLFVGVLGAKTLVDLLENGLFNGWINPAAIALADRAIPWAWMRDLLVGPYGLLTMALTYSLALVFPIVGTFFIAFGVLEDSGYLPRLAVMVNRVFKKMGLNGKAVLPMVLGLGCDTMATLTTRILETRKERLIVILLLALGVPCSAQLTVVLTMLSSMSLAAMGIWLAVVLGTIGLVGALAARVLPGKGSDFVLELPPMRMPRLGNIAVKTLARIEWYLKEAVPLFVLGTLILFVADRLDLLSGLERAAGPFLHAALGLPPETAAAFIVGFLRRDFGAAGLYHMEQAGKLDPAQVVVAVVVITLFIPCIANFFMMVKERGLKTGLAIAGFVFPFALGVGALLNWLLHAVPLPLR